MTECISIAGVATTRRKRSDGSVILRAKVRVARFTVFEISHRMSSTSTAERAKLVEKMTAARDGASGRSVVKNDARSRGAPGSRAPSWCALRSALPDKIGKSLCDTTKATSRNVRRKGRADMAMVMGLRGSA
jgi:hypothetical protein